MSHTHKPRIALISVHGDPAIEIGKEEAGGQNVYVRQVGEALARAGWTVDMFTRRVSLDQPAIVQHVPGCRTIRLTAGPMQFVPRDELFGHLETFIQALQDFQLQAGIRYPLVHTNYWLSSWVGLQLRRRQGALQVHTYHSLGAVKYQAVTDVPSIAKTRLAVEQTCLETVERVVATSPQEREHMRTLVSQRGNIQVIPCGTQVGHFGSVSRAQARQQLGLQPQDQVVLYVGRFDPRKGIETLVRAVAQSQHRDSGRLRLVIGGGYRAGQADGQEYDRIKAMVEELGLAALTQFPGRLGREVLPAYYAAADVCVVPSHYEPFGLVAIEAMACGTPVVASDVGGLQYTVVPGETGLLAAPKAVSEFAEAIDTLLAQPEQAQQMGVQGRARVLAKFSWEGVAAQLGELYQSLLSSATPAQQQGDWQQADFGVVPGARVHSSP